MIGNDGSLRAFYENIDEEQWKEDIEKRILDLENRLNKTAKKSLTTRAQQILLLHELGLLDSIQHLDIYQKDKALLLSILLNCSEDNILKDLAAINKKDPIIKNSFNYKFLHKTFKEVRLKKESKNVEIQLNEILKKEEKEKNKK